MGRSMITPTRHLRAPWPRQQRGAALLMAMVIVTLVTTVAASMVWQQWRAVQVESAERALTQSHWILRGALDWARLILREDARGNQTSGNADHLGEPWALPLEEARLSSFLAADRDQSADSTLEAFLSGDITDSQGRLNLREIGGFSGDEPAPPPRAAAPVAAAPAVPAGDVGVGGVDVGAGGEPPAMTEGKRTVEVATPTTPPPPIRIDHVEIKRGNVAFSDRYVRPN